jgi:hypothetical protein
MSASYSKLAFDAVHELVRRHVHYIAAGKGFTAFRKSLPSIAQPLILELVALTERIHPGSQYVIDASESTRFDLRGGEARDFVGKADVVELGHANVSSMITEQYDSVGVHCQRGL